MERDECGDPEWVDDEGSEAGFEGYSMEEGERGLEGGSQGTTKTGMIGRLMDYECKARCVQVNSKRQRRMLAKLRGGTVELRIETGRWRGLERQERLCKCCESGEVEDVEHLVMRCAHVKEERGKLMELMDERVEGWLSMEENERVAVAMDKACTDPAVRRAMERLWRKRFT